jgi:hypothetical protein
LFHWELKMPKLIAINTIHRPGKLANTIEVIAAGTEFAATKLETELFVLIHGAARYAKGEEGYSDADSYNVGRDQEAIDQAAADQAAADQAAADQAAADQAAADQAAADQAAADQAAADQAAADQAAADQAAADQATKDADAAKAKPAPAADADLI